MILQHYNIQEKNRIFILKGNTVPCTILRHISINKARTLQLLNSLPEVFNQFLYRLILV